MRLDIRITHEQLLKSNLKDGISITAENEDPSLVNAFWIVKIVDIQCLAFRMPQIAHRDFGTTRFFKLLSNF